MLKFKNIEPLTYIDGFWSSNCKKNDIFLKKKKFPTLVIFFEQITLSGTSRELHLSFYFKKIHSKLAKFLHLVFTGCAKQMSFYEVGAWNVFWCDFSKVGEVKKQFFLIFGIFCWWISIRLKVTAVVGYLWSEILICITSQETRQIESKVTRYFIGRGTQGPISKGSYSKYKALKCLLRSQGDSKVSW